MNNDDNLKTDEHIATDPSTHSNVINRARAYDRALIASRVLDPGIFPKILDAIEDEDVSAFIDICKEAGIEESMARSMWRATLASRKAQSFKPCW